MAADPTDHIRRVDDKGNRAQTRNDTTEIYITEVDPSKQPEDPLPQIREFFPFGLDIVGEVVEIRTTPTEHGEKNITKSSRHRIADLEHPDFFNKKYPPVEPTDKIYRWVHLPANDMHWFEVI
ncbi:hypothetical protein K440DRAFT_642091 [Wilcoxina mikolae CBS 423.85]|nr:hypothetical protein K440DRAFT_642091 [Wilcoxina mikolae CBS 423.85]